jgi:FtsP/CotA-like multicopper oxidase with cupredoxin domain
MKHEPINRQRRSLLQAGAALACAPLAGLPSWALAAESKDTLLRARIFDQRLDPANDALTQIWGFNNEFPGPVLRYRKGEEVAHRLVNELRQETTIHWHGMRVPNAMDGVSMVTQYAVPTGGHFDYRFRLPDSGTYWYHPHHNSFEQVPRGLYGAFIVEEERPPEVDREEVWVLSDMRLDDRRQQIDDFGRVRDTGNEGRIGNLLLLNGTVTGPQRIWSLRSGERLRLRLINAASARTFRLLWPGLAVTLIALDGQGIVPRPLSAEGLELGSAMRADLIIDCMAEPGTQLQVLDRGRGERVLLGCQVRDEAPLRRAPLGAPMQLAANDIAEPDMAKAIDHYIMFQGGMRGGPVIGMVDGKATKIHELIEQHGLAWTMNFTAEHEHSLMHEPLLTVRRGEHVVLHLINETDYAHPMHLHGHFFRVAAVNGKPYAHPGEWRDTVMMAPRSSLDIAFVADNPGEWMFHCHILDHAAGGMMGTIAVES